MSEYEFNSQDKIVQQMTREGLIQENLATGERENISSKKADYEYNALKTLEKAVNAAVEVNEYHKYYSSSDSKGELEEIADDEVEEYKSPYSHGECKIQNSSSSSEKSEISDEKVNLGESRNKKDRFEKQEENEKFTRKEGEKDYKFSRDDKPPAKEEPPLGGKTSLGKSSTARGGATPLLPDDNAGKDIFNKWDKKIQKAEARVAKRQKKLPKRRRLKFDKIIIEKDGEFKTKRLRFEKETLTKQQYKDRKSKKKLRRAAVAGSVKMAGWNSWKSIRRENRDEIHDAEAEYTKRAVYYGKRKLKKSVRNISDYRNPYARLERAQKKLDFYRLRRDETEYKNLPKDQKKLQKQLQKKRYKKAALKQGTQQRILRHRNFLVRAKDGSLKVIRAVKTFFTMVSSIFTIILIFVCLLFAIFILITIAVSFGTQSLLESTYQADYNQISDCSAYMKKLETDLEETISGIEDEDSEYYGYYEYIYELGEIGHNPIELMSYLAAKFIEFDLEKCKEELDSLFEEMYTLTIEVVEEPREREARDEAGNVVYDEDGNPIMETFMAKICYVTLEVKPLAEIIADRLNDEQKEYYDVYMQSSGGQQVYANCLPDVNWGELISSRFGERIHPITKERTFHSGVDIAVPVGTPLYSSAAGIVTTSAYSETAGHYIIVTMEGGWTIKYMHLDSRGVSAGTEVMRGQLLGETGNSGRSTGPHLHLEVRDAKENPIDPTFMIPSNSVIIESK